MAVNSPYQLLLSAESDLFSAQCGLDLVLKLKGNFDTCGSLFSLNQICLPSSTQDLATPRASDQPLNQSPTTEVTLPSQDYQTFRTAYPQYDIRIPFSYWVCLSLPLE